MPDQVRKKHPQVKVVATTLREVHSTNWHSWSAVAWINGATHIAPTMELDVYDRVGGGDGFAAGFVYGLLTGETEEEAVKLGWAHGALLTTFAGDTTTATLDRVKSLAKDGLDTTLAFAPRLTGAISMWRWVPFRHVDLIQLKLGEESSVIRLTLCKIPRIPQRIRLTANATPVYYRFFNERRIT
jgi:hypothetical protein